MKESFLVKINYGDSDDRVCLEDLMDAVTSHLQLLDKRFYVEEVVSRDRPLRDFGFKSKCEHCGLDLNDGNHRMIRVLIDGGKLDQQYDLCNDCFKVTVEKHNDLIK
jgi:hypothetical protein